MSKNNCNHFNALRLSAESMEHIRKKKLEELDYLVNIKELEAEKERADNIIGELNNDNINLKQEKAELTELLNDFLDAVNPDGDISLSFAVDRAKTFLQKYSDPTT